ncbi:MAG: hypothetical protein ABI972_13040 [Acidobacteriota bacterium]
MRYRQHRAILLLLSAFLIGSAYGQRTGRLNPPHLAEMPLPQRVVAEITAADAKDAAARRMGVFQQLQDIIEELSNGRTAVGRETPDEARILAEYRTAHYEALKPYEDQANRDPDFLRYMRRFDNDPGLREEILSRFFSPALRAQSEAITRQLQGRLAALRQQAPAFGGTPQQAPSMAAPNQAPRAATTSAIPQAPLPPLPSIVKAKAANVDTKVFGLALGERISLPSCGMLDFGGTSMKTCVSDDMINQLTNALAGMGGESSSAVIKIAKANCPSWMSQCQVSAELDNGRLVGISATTDGLQVEQEAGGELRAKYGTRHSRQQRFNTRTDTGAKFETWDFFWDLPGLRVEYYVINGNVNRGLLIVQTEEAYQRRLARVREEKKPKL